VNISEFFLQTTGETPIINVLSKPSSFVPDFKSLNRFFNLFFRFTGLDLITINTFSNCFGIVGNVLPDLIHTYAFILITGGFLSCEKEGFLWISLGWLGFDFLMEAGQYNPEMFINFIPKCFCSVQNID
jgi:hypothetical protein